MLTAIQFYRDFNASSSGDDDSFVMKDYLIISKKVSMLNTLSGMSTSFTPEEIADLESQPWTRKTGNFSSADFNVYASISMGGRGMSTYLFFESIPDEFFDIKPDDWTFNPESNEIPIVISKDYLTLYNFGFASTRGLPQLSEDLIKKVPLTIRLSGNGHSGVYRGKIVGFSSRLNTIAVPEEFMRYANARYSENGAGESPSRLIVEVTNPGSPEVASYMQDHGYEIAGDKAESGKASFFLSVATAIVIAVGAVISLLAFFILLLSIYLILQKSRTKLHDLMLLGYTPSQASACYYRLVATVNLCVLIAAVAVMLIASRWWTVKLHALDMSSASPWLSVTVGIAIMALITALNILTIRRLVRRAFYD